MFNEIWLGTASLWRWAVFASILSSQHFFTKHRTYSKGVYMCILCLHHSFLRLGVSGMARSFSKRLYAHDFSKAIGVCRRQGALPPAGAALQAALGAGLWFGDAGSPGMSSFWARLQKLCFGDEEMVRMVLSRKSGGWWESSGEIAYMLCASLLAFVLGNSMPASAKSSLGAKT